MKSHSIDATRVEAAETKQFPTAGVQEEEGRQKLVKPNLETKFVPH